MKTTRYFEEQVLRKRPEIEPRWREQVINSPLLSVVQVDGRIRFWVKWFVPANRSLVS